MNETTHTVGDRCAPSALASGSPRRRQAVRRIPSAAAATMMLACAAPAVAGDDPYADEVVAYAPGDGPAPGYTDAGAALGPPEQMTGEGVFPGVVSMMNAPWLPDEIVSLGGGGCLTVRFDTPVVDDPANPWGIDLLVFSNAFFVGGSSIETLFADGGTIELSADGASWTTVAGAEADGLFPTQAFVDSGPFDERPGRMPSSAVRPVNPAYALEDFVGRTYEEAVAMYAGSAGGAGVDLAVTGLEAISYVRICNDAAGQTVEIDALADVAPVVPGDANGDGAVDADDLVAVIVQWGLIGPGTTADFDGNAVVNVDDLLVVILNWS